MKQEQTQSGQSNQPTPFDLRAVSSSGRLDVLAANLIEQFAERVPEVKPILDDKREVIHASLNEKFGPHALGVDVQKIIGHARPFFPLLGMIAGQVIANYNAHSAPVAVPPKESGKEGA